MTILSLPLSIARESIAESKHACTIIRETTQKVEFLMKADDGTSFRSRISHNLREEVVIVEVQYQQKFAIGPEFSVFLRRVDRCIGEVLERGENTLSGCVVPAYNNGTAVLQYVIPLQYGFLSDQEYIDQLGAAISQCSKAMTLMITVIGDLCAAGHMLSDKECMESAYRGYAYLVPPVSAKQATGRPN